MKFLNYRVINGLGFKSATFSSHENKKVLIKLSAVQTTCVDKCLEKTNWIFIALIFTLVNNEYKPLLNSQKSWVSKENCQILICHYK